MNRPAGRISAICGVRREILSMSARPNSIPASPASAGTWRHAFVEPPSAAATVDGVLERRLREDRGRSAIVLQRVDQCRCGTPHDRLAGRIVRGGGRHAGDGEAERLRDARHGVGRVHARARALARERHALELRELVERHSPRRMSADRLVDVLDRDVAAPEAPRSDRPSVGEHRRQVEPDHRHHHPGQGLVAAGDGHEAVHPLRMDDQLDRVGDPVPRGEGRPHPLGSHGDPVGDRDRVEEERQDTERPQLLRGGDSELVEVHVARRDSVPGRRDARLRQLQVLRRPSHRPQHRAGGRLRRPARHLEASPPAPIGHAHAPSSTMTCSAVK